MHGQVLEKRLAAAEARLAGVTNLAGRLMALDQVAEELGVAVPDGEVRQRSALGVWGVTRGSELQCIRQLPRGAGPGGRGAGGGSA